MRPIKDGTARSKIIIMSRIRFEIIRVLKVPSSYSIKSSYTIRDYKNTQSSSQQCQLFKPVPEDSGFPEKDLHSNSLISISSFILSTPYVCSRALPIGDCSIMSSQSFWLNTHQCLVQVSLICQVIPAWLSFVFHLFLREACLQWSTLG